MDVNDQLKCAIGREKLYRLQREYTFRWMSSAVLPTARCEVPDACRTIAAQMETMSVDLIPRVRALDNWVPEIKNSLCAKCERVGMAEFHSARKSLWNLLPDVFGLSNWENVQNEHAIKVCIFFNQLVRGVIDLNDLGCCLG